jgi:hypothetical protein
VVPVGAGKYRGEATTSRTIVATQKVNEDEEFAVLPGYSQQQAE